MLATLKLLEQLANAIQITGPEDQLIRVKKNIKKLLRETENDFLGIQHLN